MFDLIQEYQLNLMLVIAAMCGITALFALLTKPLGNRRRRLLIVIELSAMILVLMDRYAYMYKGDPSTFGYYMVRISNFFVFFMTVSVAYHVMLYVKLILSESLKDTDKLKRLKVASVLSWIGMILVVVSQFTGLYYTFDENNVYIRAPGFIVCYIIPFAIIVIMLSLIIQYFSKMNRLVRISLLIFTVGTMIAAIVQVFAYGISITNISIAISVLILYMFALIDMNRTVAKANELQINYLKEEQDSMTRLFDQTATAFVRAVDAKDSFDHEHSRNVANYSKMIAKAIGKTEEESQEIYYAGLLHDVGKIGIPDSIIQNESTLTDEEYKVIRTKPIIADEILSSITEYPYLREGAHYCYERYDGSGYPDGLKGEDIPEAARIIAVADAYASMSSGSRYREALPKQIIREEFVNGSGTQFDPKLVSVMIDIIDKDIVSAGKGRITQTQLLCDNYRDQISGGMLIGDKTERICFKYDIHEGYDNDFSIPSLIVFYSLDGRVHNTNKSIDAYRYIEYAELWIDGHTISTMARNLRNEITENTQSLLKKGECEIEALRYEDHIKVIINTFDKKIENIIALGDTALNSYIALTGEHCNIYDITTKTLDKIVEEDDIERISDKINYINRLESDIANTQIDKTRSATTKGIELSDRIRLAFHSMSLPSSSLVWHCPYVLIYSSDDGSVEGDNYKEYSLIKLNGESSGDNSVADNDMVMNREDDFVGWDEWKELNKEGLEYEVFIIRHGNKVITTTSNLGVTIDNNTIIKADADKIYVALTGDQCALTDIRVKG